MQATKAQPPRRKAASVHVGRYPKGAESEAEPDYYSPGRQWNLKGSLYMPPRPPFHLVQI